MSEIKYACSMGRLCHSSYMLKISNLKLYSCPFDWIFCDCDVILHCIEDDFKTFLDKSYYKSVHNNSCEHTYYYPQGPVMFFHNNPLQNIEHYNYYVRCVERFRTIIKKPDAKLFTMFYHNNSKVDETLRNKIIDFNKKLSKYISNYKLMVVFHIDKHNKQYHEFTQEDNIDFLELHTLSSSNGVQFQSNHDNSYLDNIIKTRYNFNLLNIS